MSDRFGHQVLSPALGRILLAALVLAAGAPACGDEEAPVSEEAAAPEPKAKAKQDGEAKEGKEGKEAAAATPAPADAAPKIEYIYNAVGRRDPFKVAVGTQTTQVDRPVGPLQKYDLDQYKAVAVIWGTDSPVAMVEDPEGNGHFVKVGTIIGRNLGKVVRITADSLVVAEEYRDFTGQLMVNEIVMVLPDVAGSSGKR